jgi:predicted nucleic-acid-binding Zn-ribbon protein
LKKVILSDKRKSLTVTDLNELLRDKVIDRTSSETLPYKVCPKCGSKNISRSTDLIVDGEVGDDGETSQTATPFGTIRCLECGWRDDEIERDYERIKE